MSNATAALTLQELHEYRVHGDQEFGLQNKYKFSNGYGASLIYTPFSYGLELAVIDFKSDPTGRIAYDTPITDDVLGYLTWEEAVEALVKIKELPSD
ncbi:hypothetical protein [Pediococcus pentosaceus]|uniref:hypothetical protein n=1 Tax=Pediococcus pentosaceus TaxID=1255 RepID=UPI001C609E25|nr:hypothetical protein [Pediococcus pentosaceus]